MYAVVDAVSRAKGRKCSSQELEDRDHGRDLQSGASLASKFAYFQISGAKSKAEEPSDIQQIPNKSFDCRHFATTQPA